LDCARVQPAACEHYSVDVSTTDDGGSATRSCMHVPPAMLDSDEACARALPLSIFDANGDGMLSYLERSAASDHGLPDEVGKLPLRLGCRLATTTGTAKCHSTAGDDGQLDATEYAPWLSCELKRLEPSAACRARLCASAKDKAR
jgi:hypothetical protein